MGNNKSTKVKQDFDNPSKISSANSKVDYDSYDTNHNELMVLEEERENIRVGIRVRNFTMREKELNSNLIVDMDEQQVLVYDPRDQTHATCKQFTFDYCFWSFDGYRERGSDGYLESAAGGSRYADQNRIFAEIGIKLMSHGLNGFHSTLLLYGQSGTGKSYTCFGTQANKGLVPLIFENIFKQIKVREKRERCSVKCKLSMAQLYNEQLQDLLAIQDVTRKNLELFETREGILIPNLSDVEIDASNCKEILDKALRNRATAETLMNETSSRSHAIIIIKLEQELPTQNQRILSQINLVDLAGSEWNKKSQTNGIRFDEAKSINKSMTFLSLCLNALAEGRPHIPYRNSKLTLFLKNSLKENGKTFMIATISPADDNFLETMSTLRYAESVKTIVGKARVNYVNDSKDKLILELKMENEKLRLENKRLLELVPRDKLSNKQKLSSCF